MPPLRTRLDRPRHMDALENLIAAHVLLASFGYILVVRSERKFISKYKLNTVNVNSYSLTECNGGRPFGVCGT